MEGEFLRQWRLKAGLSQGDLAKHLGFECCQFISNIERGIADVPLRYVRKICSLLNVSEKKFIQIKLDVYKEKLYDELYGNNRPRT